MPEGKSKEITLRLNGEERKFQVEEQETLLHVLR